MDSDRRYGWRNHNYVFDNNVGRFMLQHRSNYTKTTSTKSTTIDATKHTIHHHAKNINNINHNDQNNKYYQEINKYKNVHSHSRYKNNNHHHPHPHPHPHPHGRNQRVIDTRYQQKLQSKYGGNTPKTNDTLANMKHNRTNQNTTKRSKTPELTELALNKTSTNTSTVSGASTRNNSNNNSPRNKKRKWMKSKSLKLRVNTKDKNKDQSSKNKPKDIDLQIAHPESVILLTQSNIALIISNWYRTYYQFNSGNGGIRKQRQRQLYRIRINPFIISALMSYAIERFEFDEHHRLIFTWINYNIPIDDDSSIDSHDQIPGLISTGNNSNNPRYDFKSKSIPIELIRMSLTSANEEEDVCNSEDSISTSTSADLSGHPPLLSPSVSNQSNGYSLLSNASNGSSLYHSSKSQQAAMRNNVNFECSASLDQVKWSTIFFGPILNESLLYKNIYVCNVSIDKLGYGLGISFFGYNGNRNYNNIFYDKQKLNENILGNNNGYPDKINDAFVLYDDGEFHDWHNNKSNVNSLPNNKHKRTKLISKLSKYKLKTQKAKQPHLVSSPSTSTSSVSSTMSTHTTGRMSITRTANLLSVPNSNGDDNDNNGHKSGSDKKVKFKKKSHSKSKSKKDFYLNARKRNMLKSASDNLIMVNDHNANNSESQQSNPSSKKKKTNFYNKGRSKKSTKSSGYKKVNEKFSFDKNDVIQIAVDLHHSRITIHNINNHKCVVLKDFNYNSIRIGFVLRFSTVTIIDQKWV